MNSKKKSSAKIAITVIGTLALIAIIAVGRINKYLLISASAPSTLSSEITQLSTTNKQTLTQSTTETTAIIPETQTTFTSVPTFDIPNPILIHNEPVSPETLAKIVGGDPAYWWQQFSLTWVYTNKSHKTLMRHPGQNMIWFLDNQVNPHNADDCRIHDSHVNNGSGMIIKYIKCPSGTQAWIETDEIGLMLFDITGYFQ